METEHYRILLHLFLLENLTHPSIILSFISMAILLVLSALLSGSETAFFSLTPTQIAQLKEHNLRTGKFFFQLINRPQRLLATLLIANNFVNIGIVIISTFITNTLFDFTQYPTLGLVVQVVIVTFLILLFGEIVLKVYAHQYAAQFATFMTVPIYLIDRCLYPFSILLISLASIAKRHFQKKETTISLDDLSGALDLTENSLEEDKDILKGIVTFTNIQVKEILKPRLDVIAIDDKDHLSLCQVECVFRESGYSRIPIYEESFDCIKGILYSKDLLPHIDDGNNFEWRTLLRTPYYVPETKKINDLLKEFQTKKIHVAMVIDEYGGTLGLVTMEDILEEIVGEISDEYDEEERVFTQLDETNYLFEGKTLLNDFYKIFEIDNSIFEPIKGDADTLAGLILEIRGEIPEKGEILEYKKFSFSIEEVDNRKIKKIKVSVLCEEEVLS